MKFSIDSCRALYQFIYNLVEKEIFCSEVITTTMTLFSVKLVKMVVKFLVYFISVCFQLTSENAVEAEVFDMT